MCIRVSQIFLRIRWDEPEKRGTYSAELAIAVPNSAVWCVRSPYSLSQYLLSVWIAPMNKLRWAWEEELLTETFEIFFQILISLPFLHAFSTAFIITTCYCRLDWLALDAVYPLDYDCGSGQSLNMYASTWYFSAYVQPRSHTQKFQSSCGG